TQKFYIFLIVYLTGCTPKISYICDFSRGGLNARFMRSHLNLASRPQICLIGGNGFCAVAGENELNRGMKLRGQKPMYSAYSILPSIAGD
ncbi:MAG: hypothetical protein ACLRH4_13555, partial [Anaerobutyricum hallii]